MVVAAGGAIGSVARYGLNRVIQTQVVGAFPLGIFVINIVGSGLIGVLAGVSSSDRWPLSPEARTFLAVGVLGGFTTFSSFSLDTLTLMRGGHISQAIGNIVGQVALSLVAVWFGFKIGARV